jgi:galactose mutarotase-like enzyme
MSYRAQTTEVAGLTAAVLDDEEAGLRATWAIGAGMLGASLMYRGDELLWQGAGVRGYVRERKFMGIPFLHPWANRLDGFSYHLHGHDVRLNRSSPLLKLDEHGLPIHGLLNASPDWSIAELEADADAARLTGAFEFAAPELLELFPFPHRVEMTVTVSSGAVQVTTTVVPTTDEPVPVAFGFHPYLQIPGVPRAEWEVAFPVRRRLLLDARQIPTGATEDVEPLTGPIGSRTWDDGFDRIEPPRRFEIRGGERTIALEYAEGYPNAQVFAPPGQEYICVEPMMVPANALRASEAALRWATPAQPVSAAFRIQPG